MKLVLFACGEVVGHVLDMSSQSLSVGNALVIAGHSGHESKALVSSSGLIATHDFLSLRLDPYLTQVKELKGCGLRDMAERSHNCARSC